jgi:Tol biopolymer transport system component
VTATVSRSHDWHGARHTRHNVGVSHVRLSDPRRPLARLAPAVLLLALVSGVSPGVATQTGDPASTNGPLEAADVAWDRGDYPAALRAYLSLLDSPGGAGLVDRVALQTGEGFQTIELTTDGEAPRYSADGRHFSYEVGRGPTRRTRVAGAAAPAQQVAELPGYGASFSPDGARVAYIRLDVTDAMRALQEAVDAASGVLRSTRLAELTRLIDAAARLVLHDLSTGHERDLGPAPAGTTVLVHAAGDVILFTGTDSDGRSQVYRLTPGSPPAALTSGPPGRVLQTLAPSGSAAIVLERSADARRRFALLSLPDGRLTQVNGSAPGFSADGRVFAYVQASVGTWQLMTGDTAAPGKATPSRSGAERIDAPALSRDGSRVAFQIMFREDWEIAVVNRDGTGERRITREIQHDVAPQFLGSDRLLGLMGEPRHRRSYLYDIEGGTRTRLFHNNTLRTISPEYRWVPSPDGTRLLIVAERDGDTISPARGVYLMDLARPVTLDALRTRLRTNLAAEEALRETGRRQFAPIAASVQRALADTSVARVFEYQRALFEFDSKHISQPGNRRAAEYLFRTYASFGYQPEYQWFRDARALGGETANVLATLRGTVNPELVYIVSSHYDSVEDGPGADDNSSGTAALL